MLARRRPSADKLAVARRLFELLVIAIVVVSSACASTGAVPRPFPMSVPTPPEGGIESARSAIIDIGAVISTAIGLRGTRYRNGGSDPTGFDCSGFVQYVFGRSGVALPRDVKEQFSAGEPVTRGDIERGDLIFFTTVAPGASHVALALDGGRFVHAPSSNGVVRVEHLESAYWSRRYVGARRFRQPVL